MISFKIVVRMYTLQSPSGKCRGMFWLGIRKIFLSLSEYQGLLQVAMRFPKIIHIFI